MAKSLSTHRPTETNSVTLTIPGIPWADEYRAEKGPNNVVDTKSYVVPFGSPSDMMFDYSIVKNAYTNTGIDATVQALSKRGFRVMLQNNEVWDYTDSADSTFLEKVPARCTITLSVLQHDAVTASVLLDFIARTVGGFYEDTGAVSNPVKSRLEAMIRGAITPVNL